jgi:hypothetical protein
MDGNKRQSILLEVIETLFMVIQAMQMLERRSFLDPKNLNGSVSKRESLAARTTSMLQKASILQM